MTEAVAPTRSRHLPFWAIIIALVICALAGVFVLLWLKLPTWAPEWVVEHSPWADPIVRVAVEYPDQQYEASAVLTARGPSVIPFMGRYLEEGDPPVRRFAAWFLRFSGEDAAIDILLPYIQDGDPLVIDHVLAFLEQEDRQIVLQERRARLVPILIGHLANGQASVRGQAAKLLGMLKEPTAVDPLLVLLRAWDPANLEHDKWCGEVITALGEIGDAKGILPLLSLFGRAANEQRIYTKVAPTLEALGKLPPGPMVDLILPFQHDFTVDVWRFEIASRLMDTRAVVALDEAMRLEEPKEKTEWDRNFAGGRGAMAAKGLAESKYPEGQRLIRAALDDPAHLIRARAVFGIAQSYGHLVDQSLLDEVARALDDPAVEVRVAAAFSYRFLSKHLSPKAVEERLIAMTVAPSPEERANSIYALGSPDVTDKAIQRIIDCTRDEDPQVRSAAWAALSKSESLRYMKTAAEGYPLATASQRRQLVYELLSNNTTFDRDKASLITQAASDDHPRVIDAFGRAKSTMGLTDAAILWMAIDL